MSNLSRKTFGPIENAPTGFFDLFDDFFTYTPHTAGKNVFKTDISEDDASYLLEADLPGIKKESINVEMKDEMLTISVDYTEEKDESDKEKNYIHRERRHTSMSRSAYLKNSDASGIEAKFDNGVLSVRVPKRTQGATGQKIEIS